MKVKSRVVLSPTGTHIDPNVNQLLSKLADTKIPLPTDDFPFPVTAVKTINKVSTFSSNCCHKESVRVKVSVRYETESPENKENLSKYLTQERIEELESDYEISVSDIYGGAVGSNGESNVSIVKITISEIFSDSSSKYMLKKSKAA